MPDVPRPPVRVVPVDREVLVAHVVDRVRERGGRVRVLLDGAAVTEPGALADALVAPLRAAGRPVARVRADHFLRPASVRLEHGRTDPDAYLEDRLDVGALVREVLAPTGDAGSGRYLPSLWDAARDRATRAPRETLPAGGVLLLDGELLLGRGLPAELVVHLTVRPATLVRRGVPEWLAPAFDRYEREAEPQRAADVVVRVDDPRHPALVLG